MSALNEVLALLPAIATADSSVVVDAVRRVGAARVALELLPRLSPSGALTEVEEGNAELDAVLDDVDAEERAFAHLESPSLVARLEDDFAACVPALADAAVPLEAWAIPLLSALAGPAAPLLSFGLTVACKVALAALKAWAERRKIANGRA